MGSNIVASVEDVIGLVNKIGSIDSSGLRDYS